MKGVQFDGIDFGGLKGVETLATLPLGINARKTFTEIIHQFQSQGYEEGKQLFGLPHDWRMGIHIDDTFWDRTKDLIERSVFLNNNSKAVIIGHSYGAQMILYFLNEKVTKEWRDKFIGKILFVSPALSGAYNVPILHYGMFPKLRLIKNRKISNFLRSLPVMYDLLPNEIFFSNQTLLSFNDKTVKANEVIEHFEKHPEFTEEQKNIMRTSIGISKKLPKDYEIETFIIYNSEIGTEFGFNETNGKSLVTSGDNSVTSKGAEWVCKNWSKIKCMDVKKNNRNFNHMGILNNPYTVDLIVKWIIGNNGTDTKSEL
ncbi:Lecithin:cholesterol acyltransferase family protein [Histomonas meleagridis]|uniref:Lecithin:cholesterol acyltransferase family protein n=1 Tax=Histomonas meleagridis TaxID=135588 RepID=UPI00355A573D|nr:Lecithin:cholesterol acyltransferase family protein [Histomonas meleagridis]KAH0797668.1 Lecithin:cholesterol acyltransferase family protein [Histomonas meleagridis]